MPKLTSRPNPITGPVKTPKPIKRLPAITAGYPEGYDLNEVPTDYLLAELVRRGVELSRVVKQ